MIGFANDNPNAFTRVMTPIILLFYLQLLAQSFIAIFRLKHVSKPKQYLYAVLLILLAPLMLLVLIPVGMRLSSNEILQFAIISTLSLHVVGSTWMWYILTRAKKNEPLEQISKDGQIVDQIEVESLDRRIAPLSREDSSTQENVATADATTPLDINMKPARRIDIVTFFIYLPGILIGAAAAYAVLLAIINTALPNFSVLQMPIFEIVGNAMGILIALSVLPCVIAALLLLIRKKKSS